MQEQGTKPKSNGKTLIAQNVKRPDLQNPMQDTERKSKIKKKNVGRNSRINIKFMCLFCEQKFEKLVTVH